MKKFSIKNKKRIVIISCVIVVILLIGLILLWHFQNNKKITTNMQFKYFGLNEYYEDDSNEIKCSEAIKVLTSLYAKIYDISEITNYEDLNLAWQNYAEDMEFISNNEYSEKLTYVKLFELLAKYEKQYRNIDTERIENKLGLTEMEYTLYQINSINYVFDNGLIKSEMINVKELNKNITKEYFEDFIVKCIFKFDLLDIGDNTINYEKSLSVNENKEYFFVTNNLDRKKAQIKKADNSETFLMPKETYPNIRADLGKICEVINEYFSIILNVDYNTITEEGFRNIIKYYPDLSYDSIYDYYNFVKENNIQISGKSEIVYPIIYYVDGEYYVRVKLEYDVISSNSKENLLFGNIKDNAKFIDVKINKNILGWFITGIREDI